MIVIDPGQAGGMISVGKAFRAIPMPKTKREICDFIKPAAGDIRAAHPGSMAQAIFPPKDAYLEELVKYAGTNMPSSAMSVYASNHGFIEGVLTALDFRIVMVPPKKWQKALGLGSRRSHASRTAWKNHLKQAAERLFPHIKVTLATADALLIYECARRGLLG